MRHGERGQVLPLWIGAIITTLMFGFLAINYGNNLRYQIRAQNAADSVAQGLMSLQSQRFNELTVALYGTAVEEYRMRHLLDGVLLAANDSGGCQDSYGSYSLVNGNAVFADGTCSTVYSDNAHEFIAALNRYTTDVTLVNDYSTRSTWTNFSNDSNSLLTHLSGVHCNNPSPLPVQPDGADCGFKYTIVGLQKRQGLLAVQEDAQNILVPGLGKTSTIANDLENQEYFDPGQIDVTACTTVPPIIPNFGPLAMTPTYAIGRAAATAVMIEEDWMQPGAIYDPAGRPANTVFQPQEKYTDFTENSNTSETYNWYGVDFGGNAAVAYVNYGVFNQPTYDNEFSVRLGWWNSIAMKPFVSPAPLISSVCK
jgi:hypothetical protein